jgi:hypothetical protein
MWSAPYYEVVCREGTRWLLHSAHRDRGEAMNFARTLERRAVRVRVQKERLDEATGVFQGLVVYETGRLRKAVPPASKPRSTLAPAAPPPSRVPGLIERLVARLAGPAAGASQGRVLTTG